MGDDHLISLQPGTVIAGRYEVVKCLGAGSMGMVYACRHRELAGHLVAVKVLFPEVAQDKVASARFRNEIFASYGVSHPNVVRAYEFIRDGDLVAYTMEYVGGGDLAERLTHPEKPIPVNDAIKILAQMCLGIQAVHDAGIIHRDLKPENILLSKEGVVKIADFGIARARFGPKLTEHGGVVGTIDYVSPEYMLNSQVDWRADIYAIGILGYEMLAGESPFRGDSVYATMTKRLKSDPPSPSAKRKDCPPELDQIILKAMARDPEKRYQSAVEMFRDLQALCPEPVTSSSASLIDVNRVPRPGPIGPKENLDEPSREEAKPESKPRGGRTGGLVVKPEIAEVGGGMAFDDSPPPAILPAPVHATDDYSNSGGSEVAPYQPSRSIDRDGMPQIAPGYESRGMEESDSGRMERMLVHPGAPVRVDSWARPLSRASYTPQTIRASSIDPMRVRHLNRMADNSSRSIWLDVLTGILAMLIGIGVGYFVLTLISPHLVRNDMNGRQTGSGLGVSIMGLFER